MFGANLSNNRHFNANDKSNRPWLLFEEVRKLTIYATELQNGNITCSFSRTGLNEITESSMSFSFHLLL